MNFSGMLRRLAAMVYEGLLVLAVLFVAAFVFLAVFGGALEPPRRHLFQLYLFVVTAVYFIWFWMHGGQTLAMKTWRLRLEMLGGGVVSLRTALLRFLLASAGMLFFGAGWWWAIFDRDHCPLHDRLTGTRVRRVDPRFPSSG